MTRIIVFQDAAGEYRWRLVAHNGRIIADSGESYTTRGNVRRAVMRFKLLAAKALPVIWKEGDASGRQEKRLRGCGWRSSRRDSEGGVGCTRSIRSNPGR